MSESDNNDRQSAELLLSYCGSDLLSEEGLRKLFERHGFADKLYSNYSITQCYYGAFFRACQNETVTEGIIRCLLESFPAAPSLFLYDGSTPLHIACLNKSMTLGIIQLLIEKAPNSARGVTCDGWIPLHYLCANREINETVAVQIAVLLIEKHPQAVRQFARDGYRDGFLPIHIAAYRAKSPEFCQVLITAYPGSVRMSDYDGCLPLHVACEHCPVATVEYLYKLYPDAINHTITMGEYPIHLAISSLCRRSNPEGAVEIVEYLLECDPNVKLQQRWHGESLLRFAYSLDYNDSNVMAGIQMIKAIYDAHPEAIEDFIRFTFHILNPHIHRQMKDFISSQQLYAHQAEDRHLMTTSGGNGRLPLHRALQDNATLGSTKLLVKGNPSAIRTSDVNGMIPLHIACEHHDSANVAKYLVGLDTTTIFVEDRGRNTALHRACRGAKYETVALLLEKYDDMSVSARNADKKLPIDLLWDNEDLDRDSIEYTDCVFRLLKAHPETTMNF